MKLIGYLIRIQLSRRQLSPINKKENEEDSSAKTKQMVLGRCYGK